MKQNIFTEHNKNVPEKIGLRALKPLSCSTGGDGGQRCEKRPPDVLFFQKVAGSWWVRSTLMTTPFWFCVSQPGLTCRIHPWPIRVTWDGLLWVPELKPLERASSMQVGPPCSLPPLRTVHDKTQLAQQSTPRPVLPSSIHEGGNEQSSFTCMLSQGFAPGCHLGAFERT